MGHRDRAGCCDSRMSDTTHCNAAASRHTSAAEPASLQQRVDFRGRFGSSRCLPFSCRWRFARGRHTRHHYSPGRLITRCRLGCDVSIRTQHIRHIPSARNCRQSVHVCRHACIPRMAGQRLLGLLCPIAAASCVYVQPPLRVSMRPRRRRRRAHAHEKEARARARKAGRAGPVPNLLIIRFRRGAQAEVAHNAPCAFSRGGRLRRVNSELPQRFVLCRHRCCLSLFPRLVFAVVKFLKRR